jgi:hypothetical protein
LRFSFLRWENGIFVFCLEKFRRDGKINEGEISGEVLE